MSRSSKQICLFSFFRCVILSFRAFIWYSVCPSMLTNSCSFFSSFVMLMSFRCGHLGSPFFRQIFFNTVGHISNCFAASFIGKWKYWDTSRMLVPPFKCRCRFYSSRPIFFNSKIMYREYHALTNLRDLIWQIQIREKAICSKLSNITVNSLIFSLIGYE